jgi:hypothetical protein
MDSQYLMALLQRETTYPLSDPVNIIWGLMGRQTRESRAEDEQLATH